MKSIPDHILDLVEDSAMKDRYSKPDDGEMQYNPYVEYEDAPDSVTDQEFMYRVRESKIRRTFRREFYPRSGEYAAIASAGVVLVTTPLMIVTNNIEIEIIGIWLAIFGSIVLGRSLLRGPYSVIMETSMKVPMVDGGNLEAERKEYVHSTIDGINGILYLVLGFGIQILTYI